MNDLPTVLVEDSLVGVSVGGYRIERLLAEGGMGLVYQARHEVIDRRFAIKVLRPEVAGDLGQAKNFLAEAQTLSALKHPNIIDIVGFGPLPDGRQYMVTEFLEGSTLEEEMSRGRLSVERVLHLADQTLTALSAAHSVGVIHRDLKPSNVFLSRGSGGVEVVKLLDFGLARLQPISFEALDGIDAVGPRSMVAGTPEYVAPEQAMGGRPDRSSDLYSLGVMLFEMLTGRLPFEPGEGAANRVIALVHAHVHEAAPSPEQIGASVGPGLTALLKELLEKSPQARPVSAAAVRTRLAMALQRPIPLATMPLPALRRWRAPAAATGGLLALCASAAVLITSNSGSAAPVALRPPAPLVPGPAVAPPPPELVAVAPVVEAPKPVVRLARAPAAKARRTCTPDERWRAATRVSLQELQQLASKSSARWAHFEEVEPSISAQVGSALSVAECEAAEQRIRKLALEWAQ